MDRASHRRARRQQLRSENVWPSGLQQSTSNHSWPKRCLCHSVIRNAEWQPHVNTFSDRKGSQRQNDLFRQRYAMWRVDRPSVAQSKSARPWTDSAEGTPRPPEAEKSCTQVSDCYKTLKAQRSKKWDTWGDKDTKGGHKLTKGVLVDLNMVWHVSLLEENVVLSP